MALSTLTTNLSGLLKTKATAETPQLYLKLTTKCMRQADSMVASTSQVKFNHEQCKYLADKLKEAVLSALSFIELINTWYSNFASYEDRARSLEIFKLLFALGKEVETFIRGCSKDAWVRSAILLTNVIEHISSLVFDLDLCRIVFSTRKSFGALPSLTVEEVASLREAVGEIVEKCSNVDKMRLQWDLSTLIQSSKSSRADRQQATFLLGRLNSRRLYPNADSSESNQSCRPDISMNSLKQIQKLGEGSSGTVHKANWLGTEVATKTFHGPSAQDFEQEVKILEGLNHPNIVSLLWYSRDVRKCYMIMELMDGDLSSLMQERLEESGNSDCPFSISEVLHIILQVAEGMLFLHEKRIVHRDLKSSNILVKCTKAREVGFKHVHVKVADFGLSRTKERSMTYSNQTLNKGTTRWMAPEMIKNGNDEGQVELQEVEGLSNYPFKVDVYSFGMVCLEILTGDVPFPTLSAHEVKMMVLAGARPQLPKNCPNTLRYLIEACWKPDPKERPRFGDICAELRHLKCAHYMTAAWAKAPRCFSSEEIKKMTNKFNKDNYIGCGFASCAMVYKGVMVDTGEVVAVNVELHAKNSKDEHANDKFRVQMDVLPQLHHNNVVGYAGFFLEKGEGILVFEYMPNGSLYDWLFEDARKVNLTWPLRRNICLGVANGIHYLHSVSQPRIVHCDIKPSHILMDQNLEPKVADFSLAYFLPDDESNTKVDRVAGTSGYMAPEYRVNGELSQKCDVYSFGFVLLEIVSGRRSIDKKLSEEQRNLLEWALRLYDEGRCIGLIDPTLDLQLDEEIEAVKIINVALLCLHNSPEKRPEMSLVVEMLQAILDADISSQLGLELEKDRLGTSTEYWPPLSFGSSSRASSLASLDSTWLQCP